MPSKRHTLQSLGGSLLIAINSRIPFSSGHFVCWINMHTWDYSFIISVVGMLGTLSWNLNSWKQCKNQNFPLLSPCLPEKFIKFKYGISCFSNFYCCCCCFSHQIFIENGWNQWVWNEVKAFKLPLSDFVFRYIQFKMQFVNN